MPLEVIRYTRGSLTIVNQLRLPHVTEYVLIDTCDDAYGAIKRMVVRGAPAIAIVAALALAVELASPDSDLTTGAQVAERVRVRLAGVLEARKTAVNLADAARKLRRVVEEAAEAGESADGTRECYIAAAEKMLRDDVDDNRRIGEYGAKWIMENVNHGEQYMKPVSVLTHCNTGSLATAGYGTALGIIRSLHEMDTLKHAYCTETRPYNQGSRLTAYELVTDLPQGMSTLITDSMAASLLSQHDISAIIVGADRVVANGDTANKIGTFQLAIVAKYHGVKFVVAAPTTSIDMRTERGEHIDIEQRPAAEVLTVTGAVATAKPGSGVIVDVGSVATIAPGITSNIGVYNPSFDVTPKDLIDAIVTEKGVMVKNANNEFELHRLFV